MKLEKKKADAAVMISSLIGAILFNYYVWPSDLLPKLLLGGFVLLWLTLVCIRKLIPISYFVIIFMILGAYWGLIGEDIRQYYIGASGCAFCQENLEIGNPCECPTESFGSVREPCSRMPVGKEILYVIKPYELPRIPGPSGKIPPPTDPFKRFSVELTNLGKITYLPHFIIGNPPHDIFFLVWAWWYPEMLIGMAIGGLIGFLFERIRVTLRKGM